MGIKSMDGTKILTLEVGWWERDPHSFAGTHPESTRLNILVVLNFQNTKFSAKC